MAGEASPTPGVAAQRSTLSIKSAPVDSAPSTPGSKRVSVAGGGGKSSGGGGGVTLPTGSRLTSTLAELARALTGAVAKQDFDCAEDVLRQLAPLQPSPEQLKVESEPTE